MANADVAEPKTQSKTSVTIEGLFKIALLALTGFMGWQQSSLTNEIGAARLERKEDNERAGKEREKLMAWALGISAKADHTVEAVGEVKKEAVAAKAAATSLKADVAKVQAVSEKTMKSVQALEPE